MHRRLCIKLFHVNLNCLRGHHLFLCTCMEFPLYRLKRTKNYCILQAAGPFGVDKKMSFHSDNGMLFPRIFLSGNTFFTNEKEKHFGIRKL